MERKAYPPVWDKPVIIDATPEPAPPLPPPEVFLPSPPPAEAFAPRTRLPLVLPDFRQFVATTPAFDARMRDLAHQANVVAELKSMGLLDPQET